jgi:hypothetical protein
VTSTRIRILIRILIRTGVRPAAKGRTTALLFAAAIATVAAAPHGTDVRSPTGRAGDRGEPEGCYDVRVGLWRAVTDRPVEKPRLPPERTADSTAYVLPPRIRLAPSTVRLPAGDGWSRAAAPEGGLPTGHRQQAWRIAPDGRLRLRFAAARSGLEGRLEATASGFEGRLRTFEAEDGAQLYERDVALARVDCASAPPVGADALRPLPRAVELRGGAALRLGGTAPQGLEEAERPSGAVGVAARTVGLFSGSDSVAYRIGANDGRIGVVQLIFPRPASADTLIARITRAFGPPDPNTAIPGAWWHNRITEVSVITSTAGGYRVLLQDPRSW